MLFNMNVLNGISLVIIIQGLFYALPVDSIDFCKMNKINIQRFQTECVLCSKNSHIECPRNATKVTSENGLQTCQLELNMGNETNPRIIKMAGCSHTCLERIPEPYCCEGYYGPNCIGKQICRLTYVQRNNIFSRS